MSESGYVEMRRDRFYLCILAFSGSGANSRRAIVAEFWFFPILNSGYRPPPVSLVGLRVVGIPETEMEG